MERLPATITRLQFREVNLAIRYFTLRTREKTTGRRYGTKVLLVSLVVTASSLAFGAPRVAERIAAGVYALDARTYASDAGAITAANAAFVVGSRGVVVIDTGISRAEGEEIIAAVRAVTARPIVLAVLTHPSQEAIFGASAFQARGIPVLAHRDAAALIAGRCATCLARLEAALGAEAMAGTRVPVPDVIVDGAATLDVIGRPLQLLAPRHASAPGALAVLDVGSATLFAGSLAAARAVPDLRDADVEGWPAALATLAATRCRHLVPSHGPAGSCADIGGFARYLADLDALVSRLLGEGVSLGELDRASALPGYAGWERYDELHRANASRAYLRLERALFDAPPAPAR
jgi:glyoxylase-like metal-dependent hydrolase (beta-lactamase superfamily II)